MSAENTPKSVVDHPLISQWLGFEQDGVARLRSGRVELGQGNSTAIVQIAADELDVRPDQIELVAGDTRECPDEGFTTSSHSIEIGGMSVRLAASAARKLLLEEAGKLLQAQPAQLRVVDGLIHIDGRPSDLTYWSVAASVDLDRPVAENAAPKPRGERRLAGMSLPRLDLPAKVTGAAFVHDLTFPDMLHGRVLHPPSRLARLRDLDIDALRREPDAVGVVRDGSFVGVVAEREEAALRLLARAAEAADWTAGPKGPDDPTAPVDPAAPIREAAGEPELSHTAGDAAAAEGRRVSTTVSRPYLSHGTVGPSCAVARWQDGRLTVWSACQGVFPLRGALAMVLDMPAEDIEVVHMHGAGCYGHNGADDVALDAAMLARGVPGRPVRVQWSRADEFASAPTGPAMRIRAEAVLDGDDRIAAMTVEVASALHGRRPGRSGSPNLLAAEYLERPFPPPKAADVPAARGGGADRNAIPYYAIPNLHVVKRVVDPPLVRTSSLRGLGAFINVFALETLMDDAAAEVGADPVAFRLDHLDDPRARDVVETTARAAGWPGPSGQGEGLGIGFARYKNKSAYCAVAVRVAVDETVRLTHAWSTVDAGEVINPDGVANQIEGGIVQSASWTLKERVQFEGNVIASRDWESYPILRFSEVPEIAIEIADRPDDPPLGVGETAQGPTAAAIGNAVRRALGVRIRDLPLTREAIVAAIG